MSALVIAALLVAPALLAQQAAPHIGYVYPAGARQGAAAEITVGGQFLDGVESAWISGSGARASVLGHAKPLTPGQANQLRQQLMELVQKGAAGPGDQARIAEIRMKLAEFVRRPSSPAIAERVTLRLELAPDAPPGERELRLVTRLGLTNPLVFCVGELPEFSEQPAKAAPEPPVRKAALRAQPNRAAPRDAVNIALPAVINGQILPGAVDRYRFEARKGQRLVFAVSARRLIPYLSDAVPGWFQATLALYDSRGKEVAYADDYRFDPDPVLFYEPPTGGEYVLEIKDAIYRGREDFVYRITAGELPFVTGIFPLGGRAGARTTVELAGWNLPVSRITHDGKGTPGKSSLEVRGSNRVPFALDTIPESTEREPNDAARSAGRLRLPIVVNGRIDRPGDQDVFRFAGRAGEEIVAEVLARRLDSPLDSVLTLADASGKQLAANDDCEDRGAGLVTHHADSRLAFKLPAKGTYYVQVRDVQGKGGPEYAYRLRIARPQPDFELRVAPASISARPGAAVPITVYALRKDGFAGDIDLELSDTPPGFALSGARIPGGADRLRLTLLIPPGRVETVQRLHMEGHAAAGGRELRRLAVPAEDMMQAFAYRHLVRAREWLVRVAGPGRAGPPWKMADGDALKLPAGGTAPLRFPLPLGRFAGQIELALSEPPEGIAIESVSRTRDGFEVLLRADGAKIKPGLRGNLILEAFRQPPSQPGAKKQAPRRQPLGALPAVPFEVVAPR